MNIRQIKRLGIKGGPTARLAIKLIGPALRAGVAKSELRQRFKAIVSDPEGHTSDPHFGALAQALVERKKLTPQLRRAEIATHAPFVPREEPAPWKQWGKDLDEQAVVQMRNACSLPVSVAGALMPDAHVGYGLPIGGVLAVDNAVIPYAVGVDIACRMKMSVLDVPVSALEGREKWLTGAIEEETCFGVGGEFKRRRQHPVMERDWEVSPVTGQYKDTAHAQLGTSGSGNHFVEFGVLTLDHPELGLEAGQYLALLSHSGSRGTGAAVANYYSKLAMELHPELPNHLRHLAWLDLDSDEGREYWNAMQLMGFYAQANHDVIHREILRHLDVKPRLQMENHHNFAWEQMYQGQRVIVHRKGATPAGLGVVGIIPGSMASPGYIVRGKGNPDSLDSAAHGAGRRMSRTAAKQKYRWPAVLDYLKHRGVKLLSAGLDEVPFVYKDIDEVMRDQQDLVTPIARFDPKLVKMCPEGERPED